MTRSGSVLLDSQWREIVADPILQTGLAYGEPVDGEDMSVDFAYNKGSDSFTSLSVGVLDLKTLDSVPPDLLDKTKKMTADIEERLRKRIKGGGYLDLDDYSKLIQVVQWHVGLAMRKKLEDTFDFPEPYPPKPDYVV